MEDNIIWTVEKLKEFKKLYTKAKDDFKASFVFEGKEIFTSYGKYVIEYLEDRFKIWKEILVILLFVLIQVVMML